MAIKSRSPASVAALRGVLAVIRNETIAKRGRGALTGDEVVTIIRRELKQRDEAIDYAKEAGRDDLVRQNQAEQAALRDYLPAGISEEDLRAAMDRAFAAGADTIGTMMSSLKKEFGSRLDGRSASQSVRAFLEQTDSS